MIDSAIYEEDGRYYMFVKAELDETRILLLESDRAEGPYRLTDRTTHVMRQVAAGPYEAPTAVRLEDGRWCLFLDFYGAHGAGQGYVPFLADSLRTGLFARADEKFCFPYGFKHGTILPITTEEYERMKAFDWSHEGYW